MYKRTQTGITPPGLGQFWRDLLARRTSLSGLPALSAGGYRNRRFAVIRDVAWITLYRVALPFPQVAFPPLYRPCRRGFLDGG